MHASRLHCAAVASAASPRSRRDAGFARAGAQVHMMRRRRMPLIIPVMIGCVTAACPSPPRDAPVDAPASTGSAADTARVSGARAGQGVEAHAPPDTFFEGSEQVWLQARARGVTFRAVGQEPGWLIEIHQDETLRIVLDYGARELELPLPAPVVDSTTWVTTYRARNEQHNVRIDIRDEPCADVMSGERMSATVVLVIDEERYHGCGRTLTLR